MDVRGLSDQQIYFQSPRVLHPHMHSQTLNKTNSTNSSRYPQYSTLYHFSTFLQHHAITQTQEGKKMGVPRTSDRGSKAVIQIQYRKFASNIGTPRSVYHRAISNGTTPKTLDSTYLQRKTSIPARI